MKKRVILLLTALFLFPVATDLSWAKPAPKHEHHQEAKKGGPPPWAPAHGYRRKFLYYPGSGIYYDAQKKQYFWVDAGVVKVGVRLPKGIKVGEEGVSVELPREMPDLKDFKR